MIRTHSLTFLAGALLLLGACQSGNVSDACDGVSCSSHGACVAANQEATCACDDGYHAEALACVADLSPCAGVTCAGHGTCVAAGTTASCSCDARFHPEGLACLADTSALVDHSDALPANGASTTDVVFADLDGDQDLDIVWVNQRDGAGTPGQLEITLNLGAGAFAAADLSSLAGLGAWFFVLPVDVDGDHDVDLVLTRAARTSPQVALLRNDGHAAFTYETAALPQVTSSPYGFTFGKAAAADVDGDDDQDLIVPMFADGAFTTDMPNLLLLNAGNGTFAVDTAGRLPAIADMADATLSIVAADLTGDGKPDLFLGESLTRPRLLVNDGSGFFADQTADDGSGAPRLPNLATLRSYRSLAFDADGDSDLDVVVISDATPVTSAAPVVYENYLFTNDGRGHFTAAALPRAAGLHDTRGVAVGDVDGDGKVDIVFANATETAPHGGTALELLLGQGGGTFAPATTLPTTTVGLFGVALGDLNGDTWPDLAAAAAEPSPVGGPPNILLLSE